MDQADKYIKWYVWTPIKERWQKANMYNLVNVSLSHV
jgi:hypothetical protein